MRTVLIAMFMLTMMAGTALGQTTAPSSTQPKIEPAAKVLLDQMRDAYRNVSSLELAGTFTLDADAGGEASNKSAGFTASFSAPTKFRHEMNEDVLVVSTGEKMFSLLIPRNQYISVDAPTERTIQLAASVGDLLREQNPSLALALSKDAGAELAEGASEIAKTGESTLKLTQSDRDIVVVLDRKTSLLRQMQVDLRKLFTQQGVPQVNKALITIDYTTTTIDAAPDAARFAFAPPPGATLIKTEMAFLGDQAAGAGDPSDSPAQKLVGQQAPSFKLEGLDGQAVSPVEQFKGQVIVLDFWATWCGPCRAAMPHLEKLHQQHRDQGVQVFAVNQRETREQAQAFITEQGLTMPALLDVNGEAAAQYLVNGIPQTVVIAKDGRVASVFVGFGEGSAEKLAEAIALAKSK